MDNSIQKIDLLIIGTGMAALTISKNIDENISFLHIEKGNNDIKCQNIKYRKDKFNVKMPFSIGLGGTTKLWHKGYTKLIRNDYKKWNLSSIFIKKLIETKNSILKMKNLPPIHVNYKSMTSKMVIKNGENFNKNLKNIWLNCSIIDLNDEYCLIIKDKRKIKVIFDKCIIAAGGINSPIIVEKFLKIKPLSFTDHIMLDLAIIKKNKILRNLSHTKNSEKNIIFSTCEETNLSTAFYLRDSITKKLSKNVIFSKSKLLDFYHSRNYIKMIVLLLTDLNLLIEILNLKLGLKFPTRYLKVVVVSEQIPLDNNIKYIDDDTIEIDWSIKEIEIKAILNNFEKIKKIYNLQQIDFIKIKKIPDYNFSSSHFSSSLALGKLVNTNFNLINYKNIHICDGSIIPTSGFANTGLTIQALSIMLAKDLNEYFCRKK